MTSSSRLAAPPRSSGAKEGPSLDAAPLVDIGSDILKDVQVSLQASLGGAELSVQELLELKAGSVVKLDLQVNDLVELKLKGALIARGEIVAVGDQFGIRIVEIGKIR